MGGNHLSYNALLAGGPAGGVIATTAGTASFFDPKSGAGATQWGYATAANAISGSTIGSIAPGTLLGATINAIMEDDSTPGPVNSFLLILNGNQTALTINQAVVNGHTFTFGAPSFSGGQTRWSATGLGSNPFTAGPDNVVFS